MVILNVSSYQMFERDPFSDIVLVMRKAGDNNILLYRALQQLSSSLLKRDTNLLPERPCNYLAAFFLIDTAF